MNESDEQIYGLFLKERRGDLLLELLNRHRESLTLFIYGFTGSMDAAEELALDTFAEVAAGPTLFSGRSAFRTWLFSVGRNLALKYIRKSRFSTMSPAGETVSLDDVNESALAEGDDTPEMELLTDERNRRLYEALSRINPDYRQILTLIYFEGMTHDEAARIMGRRKKQVYNLAERGKKALKDELLKMGFDPSAI